MKSDKLLKFISVAIWAGVALLILGIVLSYPTLAPYFYSLQRTVELPTAPPITAVNTEAAPMMPFGDETYSVTELLHHGPPPPSPTPPPAVSGTEAPPAEPTPIPTPQPTPTPAGVEPVYVTIPILNLEAPVVSISWEVVNEQPMWMVPDWKAAGWHETSAPLGIIGNTVLNGHNTTRGEVFRDLYKLEPGNAIFVEGEDGTQYTYQVSDIYILQEAGQPLEVRLENARYIQPTLDERLTLVTCHPYGSTRYRLLVIAFPAPAPEQLIQGD